MSLDLQQRIAKILLIPLILSLCGCQALPGRGSYAPGVEDDAPQMRIAIISFANNGKSGGERLAQTAMDHLHLSLSKATLVDLYEREQLGQIIAEQDLQMTGLIDPATAVEIGKIAGVTYVLIGSLTEAGVREGGFSLIGMAGYSMSKAKCVAQARLVSVETGKVELTSSGNGKKSRFSVHIMGIGGGSSYGANLLDKAMKKAVDELVQQLSRQIEKKAMIKS